MNTVALESLYPEELYALHTKVLVIVPNAWTAVSEEEQTLLSKILGSVKLSLGAVQIIALAEFEIQTLAAYRPDQIIAFGSRLKREARLYEVIHVSGISVLQADALPVLDDARKKSLWGALKQMFNR